MHHLRVNYVSTYMLSAVIQEGVMFFFPCSDPYIHQHAMREKNV